MITNDTTPAIALAVTHGGHELTVMDTAIDTTLFWDTHNARMTARVYQSKGYHLVVDCECDQCEDWKDVHSHLPTL